jgi:RNA polymerase sigma-70 factor, ECF subfamily
MLCEVGWSRQIVLLRSRFRTSSSSSTVRLCGGGGVDVWADRQPLAADLTQEAFLRAHRDWTGVREMESPGGWVRRVAMNLARSRLRRLRSEALYRARLRPPTETASAPSEPESEAFWEEVRRLPTRQAQTMALRYIDDLSVAQIAGVMGIAEGTVKALLHQGRERLRRQLTAKGLIDDEV